MRFILFIFLSLFIILLLGCSGGGSPVAPDLGDDTALYQDEKSVSSTESRTLWGAFDVGIDPASRRFGITPAPGVSAHYSSARLASPDALAGNVILEFAGLDRENSIISFDITLTNPFAKLTGYDVRAIIVSDDPEYYLVDADGAAAFPDDSGNYSLNTFLAFAKDQPSRAFGPAQSYTERGKLHFPPDPKFRKLKLIIDASYPSNCMEPYAFNEFSYDGDSIAIGVLDWQEDVDAVRIMSSFIGADENITLEYNAATDMWNGYLTDLPGTGLTVVDAWFRGALINDGNPRISIGKATSDSDEMRGLHLLDNEIGMELLCPVKAVSRGGALWGFVVLKVIDTPHEIIKPDSGKLSYELLDMFNNPLAQDEDIRVIAYVANTPVGYLIYAKEAADAAFPEINEISGEIHKLYGKAQPELAAFRDEYYDDFMAGNPQAMSIYNSILAKHGADKSSIEWMVRELETLREQRGTYARHEIESAIEPLQESAIQWVETVDETVCVSGDYLLNCIFLETKVRRLAELAQLDAIEYIEKNFVLIPQLDRSVESIRADDMWDAGYTGGTFDVLVTDLGVDDGHPALSSHLDASTQKAFSGCDYDDFNGHGTHIAGIIASTDATKRGVAYGLDKILNGKICSPYHWDWFVASFEWGGLGGYAADKAEIANFSWAMGPNINCVRDGNWPTSRYFDAYTYVYGQFFALSGGNKGNGVCEDDDGITMPSDAFNVISVGNMDDNNSTSRADDSISDSSRLGPGTTSNGEYRVKPDVAAPGTSISSCYFDWETSQNFANMSGTSMAAPHVAGAAALLMDAGLTSSLEARVMLMVTADDWNGSSTGPGSEGPDIYSGFGYINLYNALLNLGNVNFGSVKQGDSVLFRHTGQNADDHALVLWDRHCTTYYNYYPDIDLYIYEDTTGTLTDSENKARDNKRYLPAGTSNDIVYKIKANSIPSSISTYWDYAFAANGGILSAPLNAGDMDPALDYPIPIQVDVEFDIEATFTNTGDLKLRDIEATLDLDGDMTFESGSMPAQNGPALLNPGDDHVFTWHVKLHAYTSAPKHIEVDTEATAYGETFTGNSTADLEIQEPPAKLDVDPFGLDFGTLSEMEEFFVKNIGGFSLTWHIDDSAFPGWLSVNITGDTTTGEIDTVEVYVDRDTLTPGPYDHTIDITSDAGDDSVHILMEVPDPQLNVDPMILDFGEAETELNFAVSNDNNGNLIWRIDHDPPDDYPAWLSTNTDSGTVYEYEDTDQIIVMVVRGDMESSVYSHDLHFSSNGGVADVQVVMTVPDPVLYVDPLSLDFAGYDEQEEFDIENHGMGTLSWSFDTSGFPVWLSVDDNDGNTKTETDSVAVYVNRDGLEDGEYSHDIEVTSNGGSETVHVSMFVFATDLNIEPESLDFGETAGKKTLTITNATGQGEMNWQILVAPPHEFPEWLSTDVQLGKITTSNPEAEVSVFVEREGIPEGVHQYDMHFTSDGGDAIVPISMSVPENIPVMEVNLHTLDFGETIVQAQIIITNIGDAGSILEWDIPLGGMPEWMSPDKYSGEVDTTDLEIIKIDVDRTGLSPGDYAHDMGIESNGGNDSVHIDMSVANKGPTLTGPVDGYHYEVWSPLTFTWDGNPGYDGKFYFEVKYNGAHYYPFSDIPITQNFMSLPPYMVDKLAKYGTWEWAIYIIDTPNPLVKHYSGWRTVYKDRPELITPPDESVVDPSTQFTWHKALSVDPANTWYIARINGFPGADPLYFYWKNTDTAPLPPAWYAILKNVGVESMNWTIAAVSGAPSTPGGTGMTQSYAEKVKYPPSWTFYVE